MKINRNLNLVIPIEDESGVSYVHSSPISRETFEHFFIPISKTFAAIYAEGLGIIAGPRIASIMLKKIANDLGMWSGEGGVQLGLMAEIRRLSNFIRPTGEVMPLDDAAKASLISSDDMAEVENAIVFFTVASAMHKKSELMEVLPGAAKLWGAQTSSLNCTEFAASLTTSTVTANIGEKQNPVTASASSIPF